MRQRLKRFFRGSRKGQSLIEYSLLIAFLSVAAYAIMGGIGISLAGIWDSAGSTVDSAGSTATSDNTGGHHDHSHGSGRN